MIHGREAFRLRRFRGRGVDVSGVRDVGRECRIKGGDRTGKDARTAVGTEAAHGLRMRCRNAFGPAIRRNSFSAITHQT